MAFHGTAIPRVLDDRHDRPRGPGVADRVKVAQRLRIVDLYGDLGHGTGDVAPEAADRVMQAVKRSNLRSGPSLTHDLVGLLDIGDEVRVTGTVGDWLRIAAPGGGEAFLYGPLLLAEVTPDQGTTAVGRETEPTIALEPKCTPELPEGSGCWQELTEPTGCHIWIPYLAYSIVHTTWSGGCAGGKAEGEGLLGRTMGEHFHTERPATFDAGFVTEIGQFVVVDGPSEQTPPVSEEPGPDTPGGDGPLHGSIAFSQEDDGAYARGIAWSYDSSVGAESEAIGQCREYGGTRCAEAGWFQEACGALAIGSGNGYGTGWGATTAEADRGALRQCRAANDDCRIEVARCSRSEEAGGKGRRPEKERVAASASKEDDQPVATGPGALCGASEHLFEMEASNHAGCRFCYDSRLELKVKPYWSGSENPRWSGSSANGVANGAGTVTLLGDGSLIYDHEATGAFSAGLPPGHWVETTTYREGNQLLATHEGTCAEGKREGNWNFRGAVCWEAPFSNDWAFIDESAYYDCE